MLTDLSSDSIEKKVLYILTKKPTYLRALDLDLQLFQYKENRDLAREIVSFVKKHQVPPVEDTLRTHIVKTLKDSEQLESKLKVLDLFTKLPEVDLDSAQFYFKEAEDLLCGRQIYSIGEKIQDSLSNGSHSSYSDMLKDLTSEVLNIQSSSSPIKRGFLNSKESILNRKRKYVEAKQGMISGIVPFGIKALDSTLGGMKKSFLTLIYSKTGGGKTRTMMNIAHGSSRCGSKVLYFTLEMDFDLVGACFDSRSALLDSHDIIFGKLMGDEERKYDTLLRSMRAKSPENDIWLVDIPEGANTATIRKEIETYKSLHGYYPDLVIIDYAHLVEPLKKYNAGDRSTKFDCLFDEFHKIARVYNVAILTAVQESREKSKAEAKKKKQPGEEAETEEGTHNIGASNYIAPHCETVIRLKQSWEDNLRNRLYAFSDKNRVGKTGKMELMCIWKLTYVGDKCPEIAAYLPNEGVLSGV